MMLVAPTVIKAELHIFWSLLNLLEDTCTCHCFAMTASSFHELDQYVLAVVLATITSSGISNSRCYDHFVSEHKLQ